MADAGVLFLPEEQPRNNPWIHPRPYSCVHHRRWFQFYGWFRCGTNWVLIINGHPGPVKPEGMGVTSVETAKIVGILFIVIDFLVAIGIVKDGNLTTVEHEDSFFIDMDADRLIESGGIRCQVTLSRLSLIPFTNQISPGRLATRASPFGKKAMLVNCMTVYRGCHTGR